MSRRSALFRCLALAVAVVHVTCGEAPFTAPPGSSITLVANPPFVASHGGTSLVSAIVIEPAGTPVSDGTIVFFFSTIGTVDREGKTRNGVARVNFISDSRSGTATVTAFSGGDVPTPSGSPAPTPGGTGTGTVEIIVGNARVARIVLRADPSRISGSSNSTSVIATVYDNDGNPVPNVPVHFSVVTDPATEFFDSAGKPVFTDNNGEAADNVRTRRQVAGTARVQATVAGRNGFITATTDIAIR